MSLKAGQLWVVHTAEDLSHEIRQVVTAWTQFDRRHIGDQMIRSSDSVGANIVEGYGRLHSLDSLRFYSIARGSLEETISWLRRGERSGLLDQKKAKQLQHRYILLAHALNKFIRVQSPQKSAIRSKKSAVRS